MPIEKSYETTTRETLRFYSLFARCDGTCGQIVRHRNPVEEAGNSCRFNGAGKKRLVVCLKTKLCLTPLRLPDPKNGLTFPDPHYLYLIGLEQRNVE
jgi:hypothetical protein